VKVFFAAAGLLVIVLASACGRSIAQSDETPSPTSPAPQPPDLTAVGFSCRLPVASSDAPLDGKGGAQGKGGFVTFPGATFQSDPQSLGTFDAPVGKWLPVRYSWIVPDGTAYVYADGATAYVVDAAKGTVKSHSLPYPVLVLGYDTAGVYLQRVIPFSDAQPRGLDLLDPRTGAYRHLLPNQELWYSIERGGFAYAVEHGLDWGNPPTGDPQPSGNYLVRTDLNGSVYLGLMSVMAIKEASIQVIGFDRGDQPVLSARSSDYYRIYTTASIKPGGMPYSDPGGAPQYDGPPNVEWNPKGPARGDAHGIWFASKSGSIWLYTAGKGMQRVAQLPIRSPMIAGPCL
jgi:hypothetical protein